MCGISGFNWRDEELVRVMNDALRHRGPDDEGVYCDDLVSLGHRRLAILDLSAAGHQPMAYDDGRLQLVHNGEIYNFQELRTELEAAGHVFRSRTDTEVILAAYREWGESCVSRFSGMWAFCLYDRDRGVLFCSRDRFGIKPFYYFHRGDRFAFASEIKALRCHEGGFALNRRIAFDYLVNDLVDHDRETFYEDIWKLAPGHVLVFDLRTGERRESSYYSHPAGRSDPAEFHARLDAAVQSHMVADVAVGSCLSGGIDSSSIVALATRERPDFHTFSAEYGDDPGTYNERAHIDRLADHLRVQRHFVEPSAEQFAEELETALDFQDEPMISSSPFAQYKVFELARRHATPVLLDGQGADEILWGYHSAQGIYLSTLWRGFRIGRLLRLAGAHLNRRSLPYCLYPGIPDWMIRRRYKRKPLYRVLRPEMRAYPFFMPRLDSMAEYTRAWTEETNLPQLLRYEDRNSMAHSIESRVPFLDHAFVEYVINLPDEAKIGPRGTKQVLREQMAPHLPASIAWRRDKIGFETPEQRWLAYESTRTLFDRLLDSESPLFTVVDRDAFVRQRDRLGLSAVFRLACLAHVMRYMDA